MALSCSIKISSFIRSIIFDLLEYCLQGFSVFDVMRKNTHSTLENHVDAHLCIAQNILLCYFIFHKHLQLIETPTCFNAFEKKVVEEPYIFFRIHVQLYRYFAQCVNDMGNIYIIGTPDAASLTLQAHPYGFRAEHLFLVTVYYMAYYPVWQHIHFNDNRTSDRAFITLIT